MIPNREPYYPPGGMEAPGSMELMQPHIGVPNSAGVQQEQVQVSPPLRRHNMVQYQLNTNLKRQLSNFTLLKFLEFCELAGVRSKMHNKEYWQKVSEDYFTPEGTVSFVMKQDSNRQEAPNGLPEKASPPRHFELLSSLLPQFVETWVSHGVESVDIFPLLIKVEILANGSTYIESRKFCIKYSFKDGCHFDICGIARVVYNQQLKIDLFEFQNVETSRAIDLNHLSKVFEHFMESNRKQDGGFMATNRITKQPPPSMPFGIKNEVSENQQKSMMKLITDEILSLSGKSTLDMDEKLRASLQEFDTFSIMSTLVEFSTANGIASPLESLDTFLNLNKHILKETGEPYVKRQRT